jgi:hypothetical protein
VVTVWSLTMVRRGEKLFLTCIATFWAVGR